jgi:hypothetical protein
VDASGHDPRNRGRNHRPQRRRGRLASFGPSHSAEIERAAGAAGEQLDVPQAILAAVLVTFAVLQLDG